MTAMYSKRLRKELMKLHDDPPTGIKLIESDNLSEWTVELRGADGTLYQGEVFKLRITFGDSYPMEAPTVVFIPPAPIHPHVYSNGHICLSILYNHWSPALTVSSICLSLQSMLSSCAKKELPPTNDRYVQTAPKDPKKTFWTFDDDTV